jgi:2'-5' RNA ligase
MQYPDNLTTAVLIMMPPPIQKIAVPLIAEHARDILNWYPAHLTLFFPFVPFTQLEEACAKLRAICADIAPLSITLDGYNHFPNATFMQPADPTSIQALFHRLFEHFPDCPPYEGAYGNDLHPHVTIAHHENETERLQIALPAYPPQTFIVDRLHVGYGSQEVPLPFVTHDVIPLGGSSSA